MRYLVTEKTAAWLRQQMAGSGKPGAVDLDRARRQRPAFFDADAMPHPYELRYAASAGEADEQTGETAGAWIIWVPDGALVIDGEDAALASGLTAAGDPYPTGWYDLTDVLEDLSPSATGFSLYLDVETKEFSIDESDCAEPVLIATTDGKSVTQTVCSALVIGGGSLFPWKVRLFDVTSGNTTTKHVGVWLPRYGCAQLETVNNSTKIIAYGGCETYPGSTLTDATSAESADGVWADAGVFPDAARWVKCTLDPTTSGTPGVRITSLGLTANAPEGSTPTGTLVSDYFLDLRIAKIRADGSVEQYLQGSVCLCWHSDGGGGGSGHAGEDDDQSVGGSGGIFAWTASTRTIGAGGCMVGRKWYSATGTGSSKADGLYQLKVTLSASGATCEVVSGVSLGTAPSGNISYIPIYQISNAKISVDYRGAFVVPAYE